MWVSLEFLFFLKVKWIWYKGIHRQRDIVGPEVILFAILVNELNLVFDFLDFIFFI